MMDQVIATGEATWSEDLFLLMMRFGYLEKTYFTFSYSPIRDERGVPRGDLQCLHREHGPRARRTSPQDPARIGGGSPHCQGCGSALRRDARPQLSRHAVRAGLSPRR